VDVTDRERRPGVLRAVDAVVLPVPDLDAALAFYRDALGHGLLWRTPDAAAVRLPGTDAELVLDTRRPAAEVDLLVDAVDAAVTTLAAAGGAVVVAPADIPVGRVAVVADPFGNRLTLVDLGGGRYRTDPDGTVTGVAPPTSPAPTTQGHLHVEHDMARDAVADGLHALLAAVDGLDDRSLLAASRCHGWSVGDVLVHLHLGLQEMLLGLVTATDAEPDADAASYWTAALPTNDPDADDLAGVRFVRLVASAYRRPAGLVAHLRPTVDGVLTAVGHLRPARVRFQGHVLTTGDFFATWACEVAVHHLDLTAELSLPDPAPGATAIARATVEALAGGPLPAGWTDRHAVLVGAGRLPVDAADPVARARGRAPAGARLTVLAPGSAGRRTAAHHGPPRPTTAQISPAGRHPDR
jgi:predicted enzyme related to lactoylglutathione lyase